MEIYASKRYMAKAIGYKLRVIKNCQIE